MSSINCPIKGCTHEFAFGILGWDSHIAKVDNHPQYHPKIEDGDRRKIVFHNEFPEFFELAHTANRRQSGFITKVKARKSA